MKTKALALLTLGITFLISCNKSNDIPAQRIVVADVSYSLKGANLYLVNSNTTCYGDNCEGELVTMTHLVREYIITDGAFDPTDGCAYTIPVNLDDLVTCYTGATYVVYVKLSSPASTEIAAGSYPQYHTENEGNIPANGNAAFFQMVLENEALFQTHNSASNYDAVLISGGVSDGEKMTFSMQTNVSSTLTFPGLVSANLKFTDRVKDERLF
jgi:hypothetical protein